MSYSGPFPFPIAAGGTANTTFPAFMAYVSGNISNVTGDGTVYTVIFDTKVFDNTTSYNTGTGVFTVPVTGKYYFWTSIFLSTLGAGHTSGTGRIFTPGPVTNYFYFGNPFANSASGDNILNATMILSLTTADTISVGVQVTGSTKTVTVAGQALASGLFTGFGGFLLT